MTNDKIRGFLFGFWAVITIWSLVLIFIFLKKKEKE
jgi:hypothetical protein